MLFAFCFAFFTFLNFSTSKLDQDNFLRIKRNVGKVYSFDKKLDIGCLYGDRGRGIFVILLPART